MSRLTSVNATVNELCQQMGLTDQSFDDQGRLSLQFNDLPVTFTFVQDPIELLWIHADLGKKPSGAAASRFLLEAGFECWNLNRMTIGLDEKDKKAWGYTCLPVVSLRLERLENALKGMLEAAIPIQERLRQGHFDAPPPPEQDYPSPLNDGIRV